jgi:hypothetical protein
MVLSTNGDTLTANGNGQLGGNQAKRCEKRDDSARPGRSRSPLRSDRCSRARCLFVDHGGNTLDVLH